MCSLMPTISRVRLPELIELTRGGFNVDDGLIFGPLNLRGARQQTLCSLYAKANFLLRKLTLVLIPLTVHRFHAFLRGTKMCFEHDQEAPL
ncbi:hypothetical protein MVEN_02549600 [Mycena venus]|uniref:Uncharacterized protein n=1 Tax=Mycena venus TaxID=2733690 RepID=A0A8H6U3B9_9AGAR|nr:hypothetical protein MVEN_02549600 [Mycena venus]